MTPLQMVWAGAIALVVLVLSVLVGDAGAEEIRYWIGRVPYWLVRLAMLPVPQTIRRDKREELEAELDFLLHKSPGGPLTRLCRGLRFAVPLVPVAPWLDGKPIPWKAVLTGPRTRTAAIGGTLLALLGAGHPVAEVQRDLTLYRYGFTSNHKLAFEVFEAFNLIMLASVSCIAFYLLAWAVWPGTLRSSRIRLALIRWIGDAVAVTVCVLTPVVLLVDAVTESSAIKILIGMLLGSLMEAFGAWYSWEWFRWRVTRRRRRSQMIRFMTALVIFPTDGNDLVGLGRLKLDRRLPGESGRTQRKRLFADLEARLCQLTDRMLLLRKLQTVAPSRRS